MKGTWFDPERREVRLLRRHVPLAGARVLEIGCGNGRLTQRIAGAAASMISIDPNRLEVARAHRTLPRRLHTKVRFAVGSAVTLPFPDRCFDVVILSWAL
jgi:ubiquinone/menaquinone biosynthesis C-methylase UbiE